jgi:NAD(P)H-flavin reductase
MRRRDDYRQVILLHGVSYEYDLAWREQLSEIEAGDEFPLRYVATVSRSNESPGWTGETGRVEKIVEAQMDNFGLTAENTTVYLCGNPDMIAAVDEISLQRGFPPEQIRKELYWPKGREHR